MPVETEIADVVGGDRVARGRLSEKIIYSVVENSRFIYKTFIAGSTSRPGLLL